MHTPSTRRLKYLGLGTAFSNTAPSFTADRPEAPAAVRGFLIVSPLQARGLLGRASFFDLRPLAKYTKGRIGGAKFLTYGEKSEAKADFDGSGDIFDVSKLPADKRETIVFYSDGPRSWKCYKAAVLAAQAGYSGVRWMREGVEGWLKRGYAVEA